MNVEYINPFIEASTNIINQISGFSLTIGQIYHKPMPYRGNNVLVFIGFTGEVVGSAVINFSKEMACQLASAMMMGMPVTELDEVTNSAVAELCNMILGGAATLFSQKGITVDITPPTLLTGDNMQLSVHKGTVICVPILIEDDYRIEIDISYVTK